jgi:hypothetical protein
VLPPALYLGFTGFHFDPDPLLYVFPGFWYFAGTMVPRRSSQALADTARMLSNRCKRLLSKLVNTDLMSLMGVWLLRRTEMHSKVPLPYHPKLAYVESLTGSAAAVSPHLGCAGV